MQCRVSTMLFLILSFLARNSHEIKYVNYAKTFLIYKICWKTWAQRGTYKHSMNSSYYYYWCYCCCSWYYHFLLLTIIKWLRIPVLEISSPPPPMTPSPPRALKAAESAICPLSFVCHPPPHAHLVPLSCTGPASSSWPPRDPSAWAAPARVPAPGPAGSSPAARASPAVPRLAALSPARGRWEPRPPPGGGCPSGNPGSERSGGHNPEACKTQAKTRSPSPLSETAARKEAQGLSKHIHQLQCSDFIWIWIQTNYFKNDRTTAAM